MSPQQSILVATDDSQKLTNFVGALAPLGCDLYGARSPRLALNLVAQRRPTVAVIAFGQENPLRGQLISLLSQAPRASVLLIIQRVDAAAQSDLLSGLIDDVLIAPESSQLAVRVRSLLRMQQRLVLLDRRKNELERGAERAQQRMECTLYALRKAAAASQSNVQFALDALESNRQEARLALEDALEAGRRATRYLDNLLILAEGDRQELKVTLRQFPLRELVRHIIRSFRWEARARRLLLDYQVSPRLQLTADEDLIERVIENLVHNSLGHTLPGGRVHVSAHAENHAVQIVVGNTGLLIPAARRSTLLSSIRSDQANQSRSGLGLELCQRIVEAHHGSIEIEERQGWATAFVVYLPQRANGVVLQAPKPVLG